jgi:steroid delta-isomerase-like uncharacterized protein
MLSEAETMRTTLGVSHDEIRDWYEAWNRRDWAGVERLLGDNFVLRDQALKHTLHGKSDYLHYAKAWAEAFPDGVLKLDRIYGGKDTGDLVVVEYTGTGTQSGHWGLFPPSNRKVTMRFCDLLRFEHDRIVGCTTYTDLYGPLCELGHVASTALSRKDKAA